MKSITEDILEWSEKYLEPKNEHLGNVPVCPYARTARLKKTYRIIECKKFVNFQKSKNEIKERLEQLRAIDNNMKIDVLLANYFSSGIDTKKDLEEYIKLLNK